MPQSYDVVYWLDGVQRNEIVTALNAGQAEEAVLASLYSVGVKPDSIKVYNH